MGLFDNLLNNISNFASNIGNRSSNVIQNSSWNYTPPSSLRNDSVNNYIKEQNIPDHSWNTSFNPISTGSLYDAINNARQMDMQDKLNFISKYNLDSSKNYIEPRYLHLFKDENEDPGFLGFGNDTYKDNAYYPGYPSIQKDRIKDMQSILTNNGQMPEAYRDAINNAYVDTLLSNYMNEYVNEKNNFTGRLKNENEQKYQQHMKEKDQARKRA